MRRYASQNDQWDRIAPLLPGKPSDVGGAAKDNRLFVEAVLYRYRAGARVARSARLVWRFPQGPHPPSGRSRKGVWTRVFNV